MLNGGGTTILVGGVTPLFCLFCHKDSCMLLLLHTVNNGGSISEWWCTHQFSEWWWHHHSEWWFCTTIQNGGVPRHPLSWMVVGWWHHHSGWRCHTIILNGDCTTILVCQLLFVQFCSTKKKQHWHMCVVAHVCCCCCCCCCCCWKKQHWHMCVVVVVGKKNSIGTQHETSMHTYMLSVCCSVLVAVFF